MNRIWLDCSTLSNKWIINWRKRDWGWDLIERNKNRSDVLLHFIFTSIALCLLQMNEKIEEDERSPMHTPNTISAVSRLNISYSYLKSITIVNAGCCHQHLIQFVSTQLSSSHVSHSFSTINLNRWRSLGEWIHPLLLWITFPLPFTSSCTLQNWINMEWMNENGQCVSKDLF